LYLMYRYLAMEYGVPGYHKLDKCIFFSIWNKDTCFCNWQVRCLERNIKLHGLYMQASQILFAFHEFTFLEPTLDIYMIVPIS